jgi:hypothetical protein
MARRTAFELALVAFALAGLATCCIPPGGEDYRDEWTAQDEATLLSQSFCENEFVLVRATNFRTCPVPTIEPPEFASWRELQVADLEILQRDPRRDSSNDVFGGQPQAQALVQPACLDGLCDETPMLVLVANLPSIAFEFGCDWTLRISPMPLVHHSTQEAIEMVTSNQDCGAPLAPTREMDASSFTTRGPQEQEQPIGG